MAENRDQGAEELTLGKFLAQARIKAGMSLRDVEEASGKEVSNAYLSQIEKGKIAKPSPNMLHALAAVYGLPYITLMQYAGHLTSEPGVDPERRQGRAATFAVGDLTPEEEEKLLKYLEFIRFSRKRT